MITFENIFKSFGHNHVLRGVNLKVERGESMVIIGGSGTGKSVLIKTVLGLIQPDSGQILVDGGCPAAPLGNTLPASRGCLPPEPPGNFDRPND